MKKNYYHKFLGKEDMLQHAVINYVRHQYPDTLIIHVPNEGNRTPYMQFKLKYTGMIAGVPDLLIFNTNKEFNGLAIELKYGTKHQRDMLDRLKKCGWKAVWSNDFEEVKTIIDQYLRHEKSDQKHILQRRKSKNLENK